MANTVSEAARVKLANVVSLFDNLKNDSSELLWRYAQLINSSNDTTDRAFVMANKENYAIILDSVIASIVFMNYGKTVTDMAESHPEYVKVLDNKSDDLSKIHELMDKYGINSHSKGVSYNWNEVKSAMETFALPMANQDEIEAEEAQDIEYEEVPDEVFGIFDDDEDDVEYSEADEDEPEFDGFEELDDDEESGETWIEEPDELKYEEFAEEGEDTDGEEQFSEFNEPDKCEGKPESLDEVSEEELKKEYQQELHNRAEAEKMSKGAVDNFNSALANEIDNFRKEDLSKLTSDIDAVSALQMEEQAQKELEKIKDDKVFNEKERERLKKQQEEQERVEKQKRLKELYRDEPFQEPDIADISMNSLASADAVIDSVMAVYDSIYPELFQSKTLGVLTANGVMNLDEINRIHIDMPSAAYARRLWQCMMNLCGNKIISMPHNENLSIKYITKRLELSANYCPYRQVLNIYGIYQGTDGKRHRKRSYTGFRPILMKTIKAEVYGIFKGCEENVPNFIENNMQIELQQALYKLYTTMIIVRSFDISKDLSISLCCDDITNKIDLFKQIYASNPWGMSPAQTELVSNVTISNGVHNFVVVFSKEKNAGEIMFAHKALEAVLEGGGQINASELILGKGLDGNYVKINMMEEQLKVILIVAGSRSGKGVLTQSMMANLLANRIPLCYLDFKPDTCTGLWKLEEQTGYKVFAVDGKNGITKDGDKSPQIPNFPVNQPAIPEIKGHLHVMGYLKGIILMLAIAFGRKFGPGGFNGCNLNKDKMIFILDEAMIMNQKWGSLMSGLNTAKKKYDPKKNKDTGGDPEKYKYVLRLSEVLDLHHNIQEFVNSTAAESKITAIIIGQRTDIGSWKQPESQSLAKDPIGCLVAGATKKLIGRNAATEVMSQRVNGKEYLSHTGYFAMVDGDKVVPDSDDAKGNTTVCKTYMVLNKNDYDPDPKQCGVYTKSLLMNITNVTAQQSCIEDLCPGGVKDERCGFNGLVDYIGSHVNGEGGESFSIGESANLGYLSLENLAKGIGLIGEGTRYRTLEEWVYDCSYESLFTVEDFQDAISQGKSIYDIVNGAGGAEVNTNTGDQLDFGGGFTGGGSNQPDDFDDDFDLEDDEEPISEQKIQEEVQQVRNQNIFGGSMAEIREAELRKQQAQQEEARRQQALKAEENRRARQAEEVRRAEEARRIAEQSQKSDSNTGNGIEDTLKSEGFMQRIVDDGSDIMSNMFDDAAEAMGGKAEELGRSGVGDAGIGTRTSVGEAGHGQTQRSQKDVQVGQPSNPEQLTRGGHADAEHGYGTPDSAFSFDESAGKGLDFRGNSGDINIDLDEIRMGMRGIKNEPARDWGSEWKAEEGIEQDYNPYAGEPSYVYEDAPVREAAFRNVGGKSIIKPRRTLEAYEVNPDNSVGVMSPIESFKAKLYQSRRGTAYEFSRRWKLILDSISAQYRKQDGMVNRVVITNSSMYVNGKPILDVDMYLGGEFGVRMVDIVDFRELLKKFKLIEEISIDVVILEVLNKQYGRTVDRAKSVFDKHKHLQVINICDMSTYEIISSITRDGIDKGDSYERVSKDARIKRALDIAAMNKHPEKERLSPGLKEKYYSGYRDTFKNVGKNTADNLWKGNFIRGALGGTFLIVGGMIGAIIYGGLKASSLRSKPTKTRNGKDKAEEE